MAVRTMSAAFTPGPWDAGSRVVNSGGMDFTPIDAPEYAVAFVPVSKAANARLIAAAPELYEAVRLFLAYDSEDADDGVQMMLAYNDALTAAKAAFAKARGEQ
jgi:hypothetical protein